MALTSNVAILYNNLADGKTITVSSAQTAFPGSNLNLASLFSVWKSTSGTLTSVTVDVDLGSAQLVDVMGILGFNGTDSATWSPEMDDNAAFSSPSYNPGSESVFDVTEDGLFSLDHPAGKMALHIPSAQQNDRYVRFTLNDSGNPDNFLRGAVYWVSRAWQPTTNMGVNWTETRDPVSRLRSHTLTLRNLSDAEKAEVLSLFQEGRRFVLVPRPSSKETWISEVIYCELAGTFSAGARQDLPTIQWVVDLAFEEVAD